MRGRSPLGPRRSPSWPPCTGRSCWRSGRCRTRRGMTGSGCSCRRSGCWRSLAGLGAAVVVGRSGRWGKGLVVAAIAEGVASVAVMMPVPAVVLQPDRRRPAGGGGAGDGADLLLGRPLGRGDRLAQRQHPARPVGPVRDVPDVVALPQADRAGSGPPLAGSTRAGRPGSSSRTARGRSGRPSASCSSAAGRPSSSRSWACR